MTSTDLSSELKSGKTLSTIATEKGVNLQTVQQAIQTARDAQFITQINQAVAAGKMTQAKANWLLEGLNQGYLNGPGFGFDFGFGGPSGAHHPAGNWKGKATPRPTPSANSGHSVWRGGTGKGQRGSSLGQTELEAAAKALGMTSTDLSSELKSGKTLSTIATEKGVNLQTVQQAIQTARDAQFITQINQAVAAGKMTQAKANWLLEGLNQGSLNGPGFGFGFGFGFGGPSGAHHPAGNWKGKVTPTP